MAKINLLSKDISELIAAGEVIERPASVIKELVENSIDAGASHVTVEIKNGGTTYMRVTDDGCGIAAEQVSTAFMRHATSKITSKEDLDSILTLGFRGEALASISAVARVELLTKQKNDELGTIYVIEGSEELKNESTGCPDGTTIIIRDIFFNVPVRRKFMKRDSAEASAVASIMQKMILSHPEISFKLIKDNKTDMSSAGDGQLYSAVYGVYGRDFAHDLIPVDHAENGITIKGYTIKPLYSRSNRSFQNFFINGRYVKSMTCLAAIEEAYRNLIMVGKYPACVLMLEIPPETVDVNVHPSKAEVRFSDEKIIYNSVFFAVKNALMASGLMYDLELKGEEPKPESYYKTAPFEPLPHEQPKMDGFSEKNVRSEPLETAFKKDDMTEQKSEDFRIKPVSESFYSANNNNDGLAFASSKLRYGKAADIIAEPPDDKEDEEDTQAFDADTFKREDRRVQIPPKTQETETESDPLGEFSYISKQSFEKASPKKSERPPEPEPIKVIGELFKNYILAQWGENMVMIDKHAAHERVIFERLREKCSSKDSQTLLTQTEILLSENEFSAVRENAQTLSDMGFKADLSAEPFLRLSAVPILLQELNMDEVIPEIAENFLLSKNDPGTHRLDDMLHELACKAAIKANDKNSAAELQALAENVIWDERIRHCPHGRPVMFMLSKRDIEKQFKRIV